MFSHLSFKFKNLIIILNYYQLRKNRKYLLLNNLFHYGCIHLLIMLN